MYLANTANFDYGFLLRLVNTFTIETEECYVAAKGQQALESISIYSQNHPKRTYGGYGTQKLPKTLQLKIYLYNYQTETFLSYKAWKNNCGMQLFFLKLFPSFWSFGQQYYKNILLWYGANASEVVQKISTRTLGAVTQLTKTANFIAYTYEKTYLPACSDTNQVSVFFLT